jgi:hypothetical protein
MSNASPSGIRSWHEEQYGSLAFDTLFSYLKRFFTKGKEDCVKVFDVFSEFGQAHVLEGLPHSDAVSEAVGVIQVL